MKKEVKSIINMKSVAKLKLPFTGIENKKPISKECNGLLKAKLKELEDHLNITKKILREKEVELNKVNREKQRLRGEIETLRKQIYINREQEDIKEDLLKLITAFGGTESPGSEISTIINGRELVNTIGRILEQLLSEKQKMEEKYSKLFELHNMHIEVNSEIYKEQKDNLTGKTQSV
eukprot:TRINITY_DN4988_c0_g1_i2.p2 TRINITY_DN4988_c0_g1~~TRINITY_DN4988_c0_g1_i2.p2  ORF type:complete len:178 (-),score=55.12 TRINITY_DN4988_c0_g1_i2:379-912(-)